MSVTWRTDRSQLQHPFVDDLGALLASDAANWFVTGGFRSFADQDADFAKGRDAAGNVIEADAVITDARGGQSPHNYGFAGDLTLVVDGKDVWDYSDPNWQRLFGKIDAHPRLHSGIRFPIKDGPHVEAVRWKQLIPQSEVPA